MQKAAGIQPVRAGNTSAAQVLLRSMVAVASCFARSGTARVARQSCTIGPRVGCANSHFSQRGLPREKQ